MFEGLLPAPHDNNLITLLFHLGHWHGLAKLRMHTETTLEIMDEVTIALGQSLRDFQERTCSAYDTKELRREAEARKRRQAKAGMASNGEDIVKEASEVPGNNVAGSIQPGEKGNLDSNLLNDTEDIAPPPTTKKRKRSTKALKKNPPAGGDDSTTKSTDDRLTRLKKSLNLNTYKNHSLGDYTNTIRKYGTTDSYSTESVSLFSFYYKTVSSQSSIPLGRTRAPNTQKMVYAHQSKGVYSPDYPN